MAVKTKKVVLKDGREGRGVKLTSKNIGHVLSWIKDTKTEPKIKGPWSDDPRLQVHTPLGLRVARLGDVVLKLEKGYYIVLNPENFASTVKI